MKIVVLGASGILGQHMRLQIPERVDAVFVRRTGGLLHRGLDLTRRSALIEFLEEENPRAIVNLAGENCPDVVEADWRSYQRINEEVPATLAHWCYENGAHFVQVSTPAVFSGQDPPYAPGSSRNPANLYGCQKHAAEMSVQDYGFGMWTIVRPALVLGVRPIPSQGRRNPIEQMLAPGEKRAVADRWFSVSFAETVAQELWRIASGPPRAEIVHIGSGRWTRWGLAKRLTPEAFPVDHKEVPGIAPQPVDTAYAGDEDPWETEEGIRRCVEAFRDRESLGPVQRARELSLFTGQPEAVCRLGLNSGFAALEAAAANDFRRANPKTDAELLDWHRTTEAPIWSLSARHIDAEFNYAGTCAGVAARLRSAGARRVLCLGGGIGDLTLSLRRAGFDAVYHDLGGGRTEAFAAARYWMYTGGELPRLCTSGWEPLIDADQFDAICSFGFLERVRDVPSWVAAIRRALVPGGLFFARSGPEGSAPWRPAANDRPESDWDPLLAGIGFEREASSWYRRAA